MTTLERCRECGGIFQFLPRGVCTACLDEIERDYAVVRDHLRETPGATLHGVAEATGVDERRIRGFMADGRIRFAEVEAAATSCEICGTSIAGGRHCDACRRRLVQGSGEPRAAAPAPAAVAARRARTDRSGMRGRGRA